MSAVASTITVRRPRWDGPWDLADVFAADTLSEDCSRVAFSLILPHLEPYLIRTLRGARPHLRDERLLADVQAFCGQEAEHHRGHTRANKAIRDQLGPRTSGLLLGIERELERDYRRFTVERSLRWNATYAEGFEALTCAMGMTNLVDRPSTAIQGEWRRLWAWHLAEELEHRTVAFEVVDHLGVGWPARLRVGLAAQLHFLRHLGRLHRLLMAHHGVRVHAPHVPPLLRQGWRRYLRTLHPAYDPASISPPPSINALLERMEAR
jgi:uncharacterized protein